MASDGRSNRGEYSGALGEASTADRRFAAVSPDARVLVVDLGGTQLRVASADRDARLAGALRLATPADDGPEAVIRAIADTARRVTSRLGPDRHAAVCVAAPGPLDPRSGTVFATPNLAGWRDVPLRDLLAERLGLPAWVHNDANLAALGEALRGAGRGHDPLVYLTVSTGVGGGIIQDGHIVEGATGLAGELGHVIVQAGGPACNFGHRGCLEGLASGTAIGRRAQEAMASGAAGALAAVEPGPPTARDVAAAAEAGDPLSLSILGDAGRALGLAIGGFVNVFDPARVVVGGGVSGAWPLLAATVRAAAREVTMSADRRTVDIVPAALGDDAGLVGAALYAWDRMGPG